MLRSHRSLSVLLPLVVAAALLIAVPSPSTAQATFTVSANRITGSAATDDPAPDGVCDADCTLREAVQAANATAAADVITFAAAGTVALGRSGAEQANASANDLDLAQALTVRGHADGTTISIAALTGTEGRAFQTTGATLTLEDLTILGDNTSQVEEGGAILARDAEITLTRVTVRETTATSFGGGLLSERGTVEIDSSAFIEISTDGFAAAVIASGNVAAIRNSTFTDNGGVAVMFRNDDANGPLPGRTEMGVINSSFTRNFGGVWVLTDVNAVIYNSTFASNVTFGGGGIYAMSSAEFLGVVNSTFSENAGIFGGGAIRIGRAFPDDLEGTGPAGDLEARVFHTTMIGNSTPTVLVTDDNASLELLSSIVAETANDGANCSDNILSGGFNLEDASDCPFTQTGDLQDTDPLVEDLADNGGEPQGPDGDAVGLTHGLQAASPAIDAADNPEVCEPDFLREILSDGDQRGFPRPAFDSCDIGAFELQGDATLEITKSVAPGTIEPDGTATFTIVVTNPGTTPVATAGMTDTVPDDLAIQSVTPTSACPAPTTQTITCDLGTLQPGASATIGVVVTGTNPGSYVNTAAATIGGQSVATDDAPLVVATGCGGQGAEGSGIAEGVVRIQGLNRIQTSIAAAQAACSDGEAPAIVLTRADLFPDAQAGTPLAISLGAPLLLSQPDLLSQETEDEIVRVLQPGGTVYLLGGTAALSEAVLARVQQLGFTAVRYGGVNRFETAAIIAAEGLGNPGTILAADGGDFADSILAGAAAVTITDDGQVDAAVLLTSDGAVPPETQTYLDAQTTAPTVIAVGASAGQAFPSSEQVGAADRFATSVAVADRFFEQPRIAGIARGDEFPDALSGGALIGRAIYGPGPMLFTETDALPSAVATYLGNNASSLTRALIFGGPVAVSEQVETEISNALG